MGGKLAQIGSRLVDATAAKVADDFFARFVERLGGAAAAPAPVPKPPAMRALWWRLALVLAIIVGIVIYWLTR